MSMENVRKFLEMVKTDEKLARKVVELKERIKADVKLGEEKEILAEKVVPLARDCNLEFTVDDFIAFATSEVKNLSKEDLLAISGGKISRAPALGLLFAAGLAFVPSAKGNIPNLPLFEHVAEAATTAEDIEKDLTAYARSIFERTGLSTEMTLGNEIYNIIQDKVKSKLMENGLNVKVNETNSNIFHCTKDGKAFDINVKNLIFQAKDQAFYSAITNSNVPDDIALMGKNILRSVKDFDSEKEMKNAYNTFSAFVSNSLKTKGCSVFRWRDDYLCCYNLSGTKFLFGVNLRALFDGLVEEARLERRYYQPVKRSATWKEIVEHLLTELNEVNFDLDKCNKEYQQNIKADLEWLARYIHGDLSYGNCYCQGLNIFNRYGTGDATNTETAQVCVLKAFIEDGYVCGTKTLNCNKFLNTL